ncbi:MAG: hypothetical protein R3E39_31385 [Anaerolineae bacterium]
MNMRRYAVFTFASCIVFVMTLSAATLSAQDVPQHILAIASLPPLDPPLTDENFIERAVDTLQTAADAGVTGDVITEVWSKLEPAPGDFQLEDIRNNIAYRTAMYDQHFMVGLQVLNTTTKETPADLLDIPFDSPQMLERFKALFDALLPHLNENVTYVSVGNEVDVYLGNHNEWQSYQTFYEAALTYVHKTAPWIKVGVTTTYGGALDYPDEVAALNHNSDIIIFTYYPLNPDFSPRSPNAPFIDFPKMVELANGKPLILQEVGYPAAESLGSSDTDQAAFVTNVYKAWDETGNAIPFLSFFAMGDFSDEMCQDFLIYYGLPNVQQFYDFLCTLGLRHVDGTPRPAWQAFVDGAAALP